MRHGCHLCDDMLMALEAVTTCRPFELDIIDISEDETLETLYGTRVPVLLGNDEEICYYFLDEEALQAYFSRW